MTTKSGIAALVVGCVVIAVGIAGENATGSTAARWLFGVLVVLGSCVAAWSMMLPWDAKPHE